MLSCLFLLLIFAADIAYNLSLSEAQAGSTTQDTPASNTNNDAKANATNITSEQTNQLPLEHQTGVSSGPNNTTTNNNSNSRLNPFPTAATSASVAPLPAATTPLTSQPSPPRQPDDTVAANIIETAISPVSERLKNLEIGAVILIFIILVVIIIQLVVNISSNRNLFRVQNAVNGMNDQVKQLHSFASNSKKALRQADIRVENQQLNVENQINAYERMQQDLALLTTKVENAHQQSNDSMRSAADIISAIVYTCDWTIQTIAHDTVITDISSSEVQNLLSKLRLQVENLETNAQRVQPIVDQLRAACNWMLERGLLTKAMSQHTSRLMDKLTVFTRLESALREKIMLIEEVSPSQKLDELHIQQKLLREDLQAQKISVSEYVQKYMSLSADAMSLLKVGRNEAKLALNDNNNYEEIATSTPDLLMDWLDDFFQFYLQIADNSELKQHLAAVLKIAKDSIDKFNIQMEEVQVGVTLFDRRVHDMALTMTSTQHRTNTIIGLQRCGFRRKSTGEVLRRPQVIVAAS